MARDFPKTNKQTKRTRTKINTKKRKKKKKECQACKFKEVREPSWINNIHRTHRNTHVYIYDRSIVSYNLVIVLCPQNGKFLAQELANQNRALLREAESRITFYIQNIFGKAIAFFKAREMSMWTLHCHSSVFRPEGHTFLPLDHWLAVLM